MAYKSVYKVSSIFINYRGEPSHQLGRERERERAGFHSFIFFLTIRDFLQTLHIYLLGRLR